MWHSLSGISVRFRQRSSRANIRDGGLPESRLTSPDIPLGVDVDVSGSGPENFAQDQEDPDPSSNEDGLGIGRIGCRCAVVRSASPLPAAADKEHYVTHNVCASTRNALYSGTTQPDAAFGQTPTLLQRSGQGQPDHSGLTAGAALMSRLRRWCRGGPTDGH